MNRTQSGKMVLAALLTATALSGCAEFEDIFKPRIEMLSEIEQDLYRAIIASDKIEKLRTGPVRSKPAAKPAAKAPAKKPAAAPSGKKEQAESEAPVVEAAVPAVREEVAADKQEIMQASVSQEVPETQAIYLNTSEVAPVQMTFEGDAASFFNRVAGDIDYKVVESGEPRTVDLKIKANGEPLFGVAIRAANFVESDMRVRFNMEDKLIRIEYLDQQ